MPSRHHRRGLADRARLAAERRSRHRAVQCIKAREDARRTTVEKIADWTSDRVGSMSFLMLNVVWFAGWIIANVGVIPGLPPFDPFPFGFLTMIVSLEAIILSIFVLIAQNRSERIDELREEVDLQVNLIAEQELTKLLQLVSLLLEKQGIDPSKDEELQEMIAPTNIEKLERVLEDQIVDRS